MKGAEREITRREREILGYLQHSTSNREIAERLYVSPHTVETHIKNIRRKLGLRGRTWANPYLPDSTTKNTHNGDGVLSGVAYPAGEDSPAGFRAMAKSEFPTVIALSQYGARHLSLLVLSALFVASVLAAYNANSLPTPREEAGVALSAVDPDQVQAHTDSRGLPSSQPRDSAADSVPGDALVPADPRTARRVLASEMESRVLPRHVAARLAPYEEMRREVGTLYLPSYLPEGFEGWESWVQDGITYITYWRAQAGENRLGAFLSIAQGNAESRLTREDQPFEAIRVAGGMATLARKHISGLRKLTFLKGNTWVRIHASASSPSDSELIRVADSLTEYEAAAAVLAPP